MERLEALIARAKVIATALVSWLIVLQVILQTILVQVDIPEVTQFVGQALALIAGIILVLRRVTPVEDSEKGLLPKA